MNSHDWEGGSITVEDRFGDPVELTTFRCHRCGGIVSMRGIRAPFASPVEWELEANGVEGDCDLEAAKSVMGS